MRSFSFIDFVSLLSALRWTVVLVVLALGFGAPLGLGLATGRISRLAPLRWISAAAIQVIQGVPLLGLLFFFYFGMPVFLGIQVPALVAVTVAYTLYTAAFLGEIWRGGLEAVKPAQWEAGACLGLTRLAAIPLHHRAAGGAHVAPADGRLPRPAREEHLARLDHRLRRADARRPADHRRDLPAPAHVFAVVAAIYFAICFPLSL